LPQCFFVTGCAGFIGSNLVDRLLAEGHEVVGYDNLSTGRRQFLAGATKSPGFTLVEGDLLDTDALLRAMRRRPIERVFHLAANADISRGLERPRRDLEQNTIATYNILQAMLDTGAREIVFSSTGSVYGEPEVFPTPEDAPFPIQTSFYAASKVAGEGLIEAFCEGFGFRAWIYRFVSVLGERYTHGHVFDFYRKLIANPDEIEVLGNGKQTKSYMYVGDCIDGLLAGVEHGHAKVNVFNLGTDETIQVEKSLGLIIGQLGLAPAIRYSGGERGWVGDSPMIHLDCSRLRALGWRPRVSIADGVVRTLEWLMANRWVFDETPT
jgi:UDP-glucose 4-epimerase